jgi:hypothetical protein
MVQVHENHFVCINIDGPIREILVEANPLAHGLLHCLLRGHGFILHPRPVCIKGAAMHGNITAPNVNPGQEVLLYTCCKVLVIGTLYRYTGIPGRHFGYEHSASRCLVHRQSTFSLDRSQQVYYLA